MSEAGSGFRLLGWFRRHERALAAAYLVLAGLTLAAFAIAPTRAALLRRLERAADWWDDRWTRRLGRAEALVGAGRWDEAAAYLERLDRVFPARNVRHGRDKERERLLELLGRSYEAQGRGGRAMAAYQRLAAFDSLNYRNHFLEAEGAARLLSTWAEAPEARDAYSRALERFPSHLPSVRGVIRYYLDRGEFIPVVQAYERYLDAFLIQRVTVQAGGRTAVVPVLIDGLPHAVRVAFPEPVDSTGPLTIATGGFPFRVEGMTARLAPRAGRVEHTAVRALEVGPWELEQVEMAPGGVFRPLAEAGLIRRPGPLPGGTVELRLTLRLYKPVDAPLWAGVARSYRNLLEERGLALAQARTAPLPTAEEADQVIAWLVRPRDEPLPADE
ncbi:MAG TPA: tetratricopeptide repeat protein [Gemmatimonadales bacterium]|nr:tetratricopeptide repeat protein [Gemmatimonadales bacterium]